MADSFPFIVVGNKSDRADENRQVTSVQLQRFCDDNGNMLHIETSAKTNKNVEEAFLLLTEKALKRQELMQKKWKNILQVV